MAISNIPIFSMLRTRMNWHQERQRLLAENVANAETPKFRPRDLVPLDVRKPAPQAGGTLPLARTTPGHIVNLAGGTAFPVDGKTGYQIRPTGNAVNLEDEMMKVAANQMDYQAATSLYTRSIGLIKTAIGRR